MKNSKPSKNIYMFDYRDFKYVKNDSNVKRWEQGYHHLAYYIFAALCRGPYSGSRNSFLFYFSIKSPPFYHLNRLTLNVNKTIDICINMGNHNKQQHIQIDLCVRARKKLETRIITHISTVKTYIEKLPYLKQND